MRIRCNRIRASRSPSSDENGRQRKRCRVRSERLGCRPCACRPTGPTLGCTLAAPPRPRAEVVLRRRLAAGRLGERGRRRRRRDRARSRPRASRRRRRRARRRCRRGRPAAGNRAGRASAPTTAAAEYERRLAVGDEDARPRARPRSKKPSRASEASASKLVAFVLTCCGGGDSIMTERRSVSSNACSSSVGKRYGSTRSVSPASPAGTSGTASREPGDGGASTRERVAAGWASAAAIDRDTSTTKKTCDSVRASLALRACASAGCAAASPSRRTQLRRAPRRTSGCAAAAGAQPEGACDALDALRRDGERGERERARRARAERTARREEGQ